MSRDSHPTNEPDHPDRLDQLAALKGALNGGGKNQQRYVPARKLTPDLVVRAFTAAGLCSENEPVIFPKPIRFRGEDGCWLVVLDLPDGTTASQVLERREALAAGLGVNVNELVVWAKDAEPRDRRVELRVATSPVLMVEEEFQRYLPVPVRPAPRWRRWPGVAAAQAGRFVADWIAASWDFFLTIDMLAAGAVLGVAAGLLMDGTPFDVVRHVLWVLAVHLAPLLPACGLFNMLRYGHDVGREMPKGYDRNEAIASLTAQLAALNARLSASATQLGQHPDRGPR